MDSERESWAARCSSVDRAALSVTGQLLIDRAARSTSFAVARSMEPLEAPTPPRECSTMTSALLVGRSLEEHEAPWAVCCRALEALDRYWMPVKGHGKGRQATRAKTTRRMRASTLRLTARVMVVMGVPLSSLDAGGGDGEGGGGGGGGDGEGGGGGAEGEGVTRGGGEGGEGGGAATTMVGTDSTVMPSAVVAAVAVGRATESVACTWVEVVEAGTAMVAVMSTEAAATVMVTAEALTPASSATLLWIEEVSA